jgi:selenocysteine lyase/cysteine desulfurase
VAIVPSVSYGVATAAKALALPRGARILVLADDHSSPVLEWQARAASDGLVVETLPRPPNGDWTAALLHRLDDGAAPRIDVASVSSVHWSDGGAIDLARAAPLLRASGAALIVDATHAAGVASLDMRALDPDFLVFPTYKWLLGPYGRAFLYVAKRHQEGVPLEQTSYGRRAVTSERAPYFRDTRYVPDARRYDMGERDHFVGLEMAAVGMEMVADWGVAAIRGRLAMLTDRLARGLTGLDVGVPDAPLRAPHILSLAVADGAPLVERLARRGIHVALRLDRIRISPHVYNDEEDVDRFVAAFRSLLS